MINCQLVNTVRRTKQVSTFSRYSLALEQPHNSGIARNNNFGTFVLEQLLTKLSNAGSRLVLLLDEFDDFLKHPVLNSAEFYGGLRSLTSRSPGLLLVLAARQNLAQLNQLTQEINPHGFPYFNVFT